MNYLVDFEKLPWIKATEGMRYKNFTNGDKTIRLLELSEGFEEHEWCMKSHTNYILEGEFSANFDGEEITFGKGDIIYIPNDKKHKAIVKKSQKVLMLDF